MNAIKNLNVSTKLVLSFSLMIALMGIIGLAGFFSMNVIQHQLENIFSEKMPAIDYLIETDRDLQQLLVAERSMIFTDTGSDVFKGFVAEYETNLEQADTRWEKYKALAETPEEKAIIPKFEAARSEWKKESRKVVEGRLADTRQGRQESIHLTIGSAKNTFEAMRDFIDQLTEINLSNAGKANQYAGSTYRKTAALLFSVMGIGIVLGIFFMWLIGRGITQPIRQVVAFAAKLRRGDLSARLQEGGDEIGQMSAALNDVVAELNKKTDIAIAISKGDLKHDVEIASEEDTFGKALQTMVSSLNDIVVELNNAANQMDAGSQQVSDSSQSLSQGATEQAASLEEITSSITQISVQTKTNAENASQANQIAVSTRASAENGVTQMKEMTAAMEAIGESSQEIAKIIKAIDDIAFQTNLLALNAAVEAARAGNNGKGFAVVAQEVRSLAARSAKAAQETTELIERAVKKIEAGRGIAQKTSASLDDINAGVAKSTDLIGEIAAASREQAQGITQVNQGLTQIDSVTQQNTANAEETSAAAEELFSQSAVLRKTLTHFSVKTHATPQETFPVSNNNAINKNKRINGQWATHRAPTPKPLEIDLPAEMGVPLEITAGHLQKVWGVTPEKIFKLDDAEFGRY